MRKWLALILLFPLNPATAEETVSATCYGNELRGHRTASGEKFNLSQKLDRVS